MVNDEGWELAGNVTTIKRRWNESNTAVARPNLVYDNFIPSDLVQSRITGIAPVQRFTFVSPFTP